MAKKAKKMETGESILHKKINILICVDNLILDTYNSLESCLTEEINTQYPENSQYFFYSKSKANSIQTVEEKYKLNMDVLFPSRYKKTFLHSFQPLKNVKIDFLVVEICDWLHSDYFNDLRIIDPGYSILVYSLSMPVDTVLTNYNFKALKFSHRSDKVDSAFGVKGAMDRIGSICTQREDEALAWSLDEGNVFRVGILMDTQKSNFRYIYAEDTILDRFIDYEDKDEKGGESGEVDEEDFGGLEVEEGIGGDEAIGAGRGAKRGDQRRRRHRLIRFYPVLSRRLSKAEIEVKNQGMTEVDADEWDSIKQMGKIEKGKYEIFFTPKKLDLLVSRGHYFYSKRNLSENFKKIYIAWKDYCSKVDPETVVEVPKKLKIVTKRSNFGQIGKMLNAPNKPEKYKKLKYIPMEVVSRDELETEEGSHAVEERLKTLEYPVIIKPDSACSIKHSHSFKVIRGPENIISELKALFDFYGADEPQLTIQKFIEGNIHVIKAFCIGENGFCMVQPSLDEKEQQSVGDEVHDFLKLKKDYLDDVDVKRFEGIVDFTKMVSKKLKLRILATDFLLVDGDPSYYLIDVNFFSGIKTKRFKPHFLEFLKGL